MPPDVFWLVTQTTVWMPMAKSLEFVERIRWRLEEAGVVG